MEIEQINRAIDQIESELDGVVDLKAIAKQAGYTQKCFNRVFLLLSGMTASEYIRRRRMTLAGIDLKYHKMRVIDVALKYGYRSPTSFARTFRSFHGINPKKVGEETAFLKSFPRILFQITMQPIMSPIRKEILELCGKKYEASYFGEKDMAPWSEQYSKRAYWRLENAYSDFCEYRTCSSVLPYNNYPPIGIQPREVFLIEYTRKSDGERERRVYRSDGTVWNGLPCTVELAIAYDTPQRFGKIRIGEKTYDYAYYGESDMRSWSAVYEKRCFYRLQDAYADLARFGFLGDVLPYNNYPNIPIEKGDAFLIDYFRKDSGARERWIYLADGTVWNEMPCTHRVRIDEGLICG